MIQEHIKPAFDTLYLLRKDTATNTEIYYHETVKIIDSPKKSIDYIIDILPIILTFVAVWWAISSGKRQLKTQRLYRLEDNQKRKEEKELDYKERRLAVKPLLNTVVDYTNNKAVVNIYNFGLGPALINNFFFIYNEKIYDSIYDVVSIITNKENDFISDESKVMFSKMGFEINSNGISNLFDLTFINNDKLKKYKDEFEKIHLVIEYSNIYNDKFEPIHIIFNQ